MGPAILLMLGAEGWSVYCWAPSSAQAHTKAAMEMIDILGVTVAENEGMVVVGIDRLVWRHGPLGISELAWKPKLE